MSLLNTTCPLAKDEKVTYVLKMPILSIYPPVSIINSLEVLGKLD